MSYYGWGGGWRPPTGDPWAGLLDGGDGGSTPISTPVTGTFGAWLISQGVADWNAWTALSPAQKQEYYGQWGVANPDGFANFKDLPGSQEYIGGDPNRRDYEYYLSQGGELPFEEWMVAQKEQEEGGPTVTDPSIPPEPPLPPTEPGEPGVPPEPGEPDFSGQLAAAVEAYQKQIGAWGESQAAEAQRLSARNIGKLSRMTQQALLAQGRTAGEIEQLTAGGMEAGSRSLSDLIKQINLQTQGQQAQAAQFGIGTMISAEELGIRQREMALAGGQFQQSLAEQVRQFNLAQRQQAGQYSQYMAQRRAEQPAWWEEPLSSFAGGLGAGVSAWALGRA